MTLRFDTAFCRLVGIDLPIVQAPVGGITTPALAAAVSEAGGLGMLSITWREPNALRSAARHPGADGETVRRQSGPGLGSRRAAGDRARGGRAHRLLFLG